MALSERYLLQGACYGLEQCGLLLQDSAALYERSRYSTADGHAAAQRLRRSAEEVQPSPPIWQTIRHSASATGWTDRRGSLTSAMPVRRLSALIRSRLTGVGSFCTAATSIARQAESVESGCASAITLTMPTIVRSLPVW